jgi:hypothetical protein
MQVDVIGGGDSVEMLVSSYILHPIPRQSKRSCCSFLWVVCLSFTSVIERSNTNAIQPLLDPHERLLAIQSVRSITALDLNHVHLPPPSPPSSSSSAE